MLVAATIVVIVLLIWIGINLETAIKGAGTSYLESRAQRAAIEARLRRIEKRLAKLTANTTGLEDLVGLAAFSLSQSCPIVDMEPDYDLEHRLSTRGKSLLSSARTALDRLANR